MFVGWDAQFQDYLAPLSRSSGSGGYGIGRQRSRGTPAAAVHTGTPQTTVSNHREVKEASGCDAVMNANFQPCTTASPARCGPTSVVLEVFTAQMGETVDTDSGIPDLWAALQSQVH